MAQQSDTGLFWTSKDMGLTYSHGDSLTVETTALVVQAMVNTKSHPRLIALALDWISSQRDARGTWNSTQATVQAMRALLMSMVEERLRRTPRFKIMVNGQPAKTLTITEETGDVFHLVSLTDHVQQGDNAISLSVDNDALLSYQIVGVHYVPRPESLVLKDKVLEISTNYATHELTIDDLLTVQVTLKYNRPEKAPMTLVDLGIPPGFEIQSASFRSFCFCMAMASVARTYSKSRSMAHPS